MQRFLPVLLCALLSAPLPVNAAHRQHGAHVHGVATLTVALEDHQLDVEFESPAINLLGFEHAPRDEQQRRAVRQAAQRLREPSALFAFTEAAHCVSVGTKVNSALLETPEDKQDGDDGEHHHADFNAVYGFRCEQPQALRSVAVHLFKQFGGIRKINAQWLTATAQNASVLTPGEYRITLQ